MTCYPRNWSMWLVVPMLALAATAVNAQPYSTLAFDNATVWQTGPRPGDNGKIFFDIEGTNNGDFAAFGVADFDSTTLGIDFTVTGVNSITITLTQDNAAFSTSGAINFYVTEDTTDSIQPDPVNPAVVFDLGDPNGEGLNGQLSPIHFLGSGTFNLGMNGDVDTFMFMPDDATAAYIAGQINNGSVLRIVVTPGDPNVSATYAGSSNTIYTGPMITLDVSG